MDPIHQELLRQAVEAAKNNDIDTAIIKVKEVLEEDEENAKAWLLLARLTSNNDEKRIALASLLQLEPDNEKAKELLAKLETQVKTRDEEEVLPGVSRRLVRFIVGGLVIFVILMIGLIALIGQNRSAADAQATRVALNDLATAQEFEAQQTRQLEQQTQIALDITAAFVAINPPTATPTLTPYPSETLPPSATPTPTLIPPPTDLTGIMVGRSGNINRLDTAEKLVMFSLTTGNVVPIANLRGQTVTTFAGGTQFAYVFEDVNNNYAITVELADVEGVEIASNLTAPETIQAYIESRHPHFSVDGSRMALIGT
ncbi:MAG TPA: tetratricopeptide repeat protein, partial [Aggregatilineales bacterium]|nr:tetratricopeptide repeat protein [Aggregatilineales bacterium]